MPITEFLERNAREFRDETALVEINPEFKPESRITWREYSLMQPEPGEPLWAQVAPPNVASLRMFLAAGYRTVCAEVLFGP